MRTDFEIRPITDYADMKRAVDFQRTVWGPAFGELVPAAVFWFSHRIGAVLAGAFDAAGQMVGLVFGVTGWKDGRPVHWSDMLGVHPDARGRGIGIALKRFQRDRLLEDGVTVVHWTFDPLESRNAWINFARLGITAREYVRDCYGASSSPLHRGIGTDRLIADWVLDSPRVRERMDEANATAAVDLATVPLINPPGESPRLELAEPLLRLRIPTDIQAVKETDEVAARRWREHTRSAFETYFSRGYEAVELVRENAGTSAYLLERGSV